MIAPRQHVSYWQGARQRGDCKPDCGVARSWATGQAMTIPTSSNASRETNAGLADQRIAARLADMGGMPLTGSPADFGKLIADETDKWSKVIRAAGIKAE
jgi:tripartite-type tricarboxylate transporter receptor subunit TctC